MLLLDRRKPSLKIVDCGELGILLKDQVFEMILCPTLYHADLMAKC